MADLRRLPGRTPRLPLAWSRPGQDNCGGASLAGLDGRGGAPAASRCFDGRGGVSVGTRALAVAAMPQLALCASTGAAAPQSALGTAKLPPVEGRSVALLWHAPELPMAWVHSGHEGGGGASALGPRPSGRRPRWFSGPRCSRPPESGARGPRRSRRASAGSLGLGGRGGAPVRSQGPDGRGEASAVGARGYLRGNPGQRQRLRGIGDRDRGGRNQEKK